MVVSCDQPYSPTFCPLPLYSAHLLPVNPGWKYTWKVAKLKGQAHGRGTQWALPPSTYNTRVVCNIRHVLLHRYVELRSYIAKLGHRNDTTRVLAVRK